MIVPLDIALIIFLATTAIAAITVRDLLAAIAILGVYTYVMATIYVQMNAVDVGFTEAAIGAGVSTVLMVASLAKLRRWESKKKRGLIKPAIGLISVILIGSLFVYAVEDLPPFDDPYSPANRWIKLFTVEDNELSEDLSKGVLPDEIRSRIYAIGYSEENNFPSLDEGKYLIKWNEEQKGWDVYIQRGELYYPGFEKLYFIKSDDGTLKLYRYSIPVRWQEKCEEEMDTPNMVTAGLADYRGYDTLGETTVIFTAAVSVVMLLREEGIF